MKAVNKGSYPLYSLGAEALPTLTEVTEIGFIFLVQFTGLKLFHFSYPTGMPALSPAHSSQWVSSQLFTNPGSEQDQGTEAALEKLPTHHHLPQYVFSVGFSLKT